MIFDLDVLNNNRARYIVVAEAFLPILIALCSCLSLCRKHDRLSRGRKGFLAVLYIVSAILWGLSLFVSSMNFDDIALIIFASISAILLCTCVYLCYYHAHLRIFATLIVNFIVILGVVTAVSSPATDNYASMLTALTFVPVGFVLTLGMNHVPILG